MSKFLKKIRTRRAENNATTPRKQSKGGIFRRSGRQGKVVVKSNSSSKQYEAPPDLAPALTMSLSEEMDEDEDEDVTILSMAEIVAHSTLQEEPTVTFTEKQVMQNTLQHMRELSTKEREVFKMKSVLEELKSIHWAEIEEKEQEIAACKSDFEQKLNEKEGELCVVKIELIETKREFKQVSSVLIETQHELHESKNTIWGTWNW
jgi:hypothetical protein